MRKANIPRRTVHGRRTIVRFWLLVLLVVVIGVVVGMAQEGQIPLPPGAVARLGLGEIGWSDRAVVFSPDGEYLALATSLGIKLRDVGTGRLVTFFQGDTVTVLCVAFSTDGRCLASGSWDGTVLIWDVQAILNK